jgi:MFS family permease
LARNIARRYDQRFSISKRNSFTVVGSIILAFIVVDMVFSFAATTVSVSANWEIALFVVIACVYGISQYLILNFIKHKTKQIRASVPLLRMLYKFVTVFQYVALAFIASVVIEIFLTSSYNTAILNWGTSINYAISGSIWGILAFRFLVWYRSVRSFVVLLYALTSIIISIAFLTWLPYNAGVLSEMSAERNIQTPPTPYQFYDLNSTMGKLQYYSGILIVIATFLLWVSSVLMLHKYSQSFGRIKFWSLAAILLLFLVMTPTGLLFAYVPTILGISSSDIPLHITMLYTLVPGLLGGFLFAAPYFAIAKHIPSNKSFLKEYLILAAWGLILFNVTTSGNVLNAAYPPFGFSDVMLEVTASSLILLGLYCSAISISSDTKLRQLIRKSVQEETKVLGNIGAAQTKIETEKRVLNIVKEHSEIINEQTGVQPSLTEEDIKHYLDDVLGEIQRKK